MKAIGTMEMCKFFLPYLDSELTLVSRNIGRFAPIRDNLQPGKHTVTCELLEETSDPGGGHEFRMISMMRWVYPLYASWSNVADFDISI